MPKHMHNVLFFIAGVHFLSFVLVTASEDFDEEDDSTSLLQQPVVVASRVAGQGASKAWPLVIPLRKENVPIIRNGKTVAHKTSYSGAISVGRPVQDFRVVFDTGSGHVIVPSSVCESESCAVHRRFDLAASSSGTAVNADGTEVPADELGDQVTVGFATGKVTGEFVRDQVCLNGPGTDLEVCIEVNVIAAVEMTTQPFKAFDFDGIFGLGLSALAVAPEFSYMNRFLGADLGASAQFGFFIAGGAEGTENAGEIAMGGYNRQRLLTPLKWAPVANKQLGHWQVEIKEVRIGNLTLDICKDGSCRGVVDTGTSHFGVPGGGINAFRSLMTVPSNPGDEDCREVEAPSIELVLEGFTITLGPENYMRPLPLAAAPSPASGAVASSGGPPRATCTPKIMPVNMAAPMGPNLFLLGEPILQRYYTVYDWKSASIGFGLAATPGNRAELAKQGLAPMPDDFDELDEIDPEQIFSFMQVQVVVSVRKRRLSGSDLAAPAASVLALPAPAMEHDMVVSRTSH